MTVEVEAIGGCCACDDAATGADDGGGVAAADCEVLGADSALTAEVEAWEGESACADADVNVAGAMDPGTGKPDGTCDDADDAKEVVEKEDEGGKG